MADKDQEILVVCSFSDKQEKLILPGYAPSFSCGSLILCNNAAPDQTTMAPYEVRVYLWNMEDMK